MVTKLPYRLVPTPEQTLRAHGDTMTKKPQILMSPLASHSLERLKANTQGEASVAQDLSVAAMLSQLHQATATLLSEMQIADEPLAKRIAMAKDVAKLLPLLAQAERRVGKKWKGKDVEDMTDRELRQAQRALRVVRTK